MVGEEPTPGGEGGYGEKPSRLRKSPQQRKREASAKERRNLYAQCCDHP